MEATKENPECGDTPGSQKTANGSAGTTDENNFSRDFAGVNGNGSIQDAARAYLARGWQPLPVQNGKNPGYGNWQNFRCAPEDVDALFSDRGNIGLLNGAPSHGLVDVDLDTDTAVAIAGVFLPPTALIGGHDNRPGSHAFYQLAVADGNSPPDGKTQQFKYTLEKIETMVVELRATGSQTVVAPSRHPDGGHYRWEQYGEPGRVTYEALLLAVRKIAIAATLAEFWPNPGRHNTGLAVAGMLYSCGVAEADARVMVEAAARVDGHQGVADRVRTVTDTYRNAENGKPVKGIPSLKDCFPAEVVNKLTEWCHSIATRSPQHEFTHATDAGETDAGAHTPRSARPDIPITTDITTVVNEAEHALLALPHGPHLFQRIDALCFISHTKRAPKWLARESGAPSIVACSPAQLRERMSQAADWVKWVARSEEWAPALPPAWAVETLHGRQDWNFSVLTDVVSSPTLGDDGAIICTPGYDLDTGLFLDTQGVLFPPIPEQPTLDEAVRAVAALRNPFADFPFAGEDGKSAALSAILSLVARPAIDGCVPLFAVDSTTRGTGKGLLIDVVSTIATGRFAPRWAQSPDGEEDRKRLLTIAIAGDACVHIDNLTHPLGTGPLDSAITSRVIKDRLLGLNRVVEAPFNCVLFASGNNISYAGDMARRVVPIHLESLEEHPENRDDFQHPRLLAWVRQERPRLVVEALTILRAYFVAGCPKQGIPALGSFEEWSDLVRSALIWAGCPDPCEGRKTLEAEADPGYENLAQLLHCWAACYGSKAVTLSSVIGDVGQRSADMSVRINTANEWNELGEALAAFDPRFDGKRLDVKRIGIGLRAIKGRVLGPYRLIQVGKSQGGVALWALQQV